MPFSLPLLEIFLGVLGFGLSIMLCTHICRACSRLRKQQMEQEMWRRREQDGRPPSIFVIPLPRSTSQQDAEDLRVTQRSQELRAPPRYSTAVYCGAPPPYNELEFKPDDLPPPYTEHNIAPPPHTDMV